MNWLKNLIKILLNCRRIYILNVKSSYLFQEMVSVRLESLENLFYMPA